MDLASRFLEPVPETTKLFPQTSPIHHHNLDYAAAFIARCHPGNSRCSAASRLSEPLAYDRCRRLPLACLLGLKNGVVTSDGGRCLLWTPIRPMTQAATPTSDTCNHPDDKTTAP